MSEFNDLIKLNTPPKGFSPGVEWDGNTGHITTGPLSDEPTNDGWNSILKESGFDPEQFCIVGESIRCSVNVDSEGVRQKWFKVKISPRLLSNVNVDELVERIHAFPAPDKHEHQPHTKSRVIVLTDQHIGKHERDGGGSEKIVKKWMDGVREALSDGPFKEVCIVLGGDTIEGYVSQNGTNIGNSDMTLQEMIRVAQNLVVKTIQQARMVANRVVVCAVPGNHGETTRQQKRPMRDNYDIIIASSVQQAVQLAGLDDVTFFFPEENCADVTFPFGQAQITLIHGHLFKGQLNGAKKWWSGHTMNNTPAARSNILIAGHFHNMLMQNVAHKKWVVFAPSLEERSQWFYNATGTLSESAVLSFDVDRKSRPANIRLNDGFRED